MLARARESNAAVYTIGIFDDDDVDKNPGVLKSLARTTGGERYLPRSAGELLTACERIAREIRGGYTIGYVPPGARRRLSPRQGGDGAGDRSRAQGPDAPGLLRRGRAARTHP